MGRVHVVGAGLAGLACALRLAARGVEVAVYEAAGHAGGRCRSFFDQSLECDIDNGNHLLMSANTAALDYLTEIGARDSLIEPDAAFPFIDLGTGQTWTVRPNNGPIPWWLLNRSRGIPDTRLTDYLGAARLALAGRDRTVGDCVPTAGPLWERFWEPFTVAVLNTPAADASAQLVWMVLRESFMRGARYCKPMIAREGLSVSFIDPALKQLRSKGIEPAFGARLRAAALEDGKVSSLDFGGDSVPVGPDDRVVLAIPPAGAAAILPEVTVPRTSCTIFNAHMRLDQTVEMPNGIPFLGVIGGTAQWLIVRQNVISATISAADHLMEEPADSIADRVWDDTRRALNLNLAERPPIRVIKERRATFAQTPEEIRRRPGTRTRMSNLILAGDWTDTGFPATIEGAIRSGHAAAAALAGQ
ncbi:MAG: hydroxysqualene dehydroxylase HpnE [Minwuiales bacterium]|nr:hydroxysqualene dehydroxylase HpnE [Minwuiales bacterium]